MLISSLFLVYWLGNSAWLISTLAKRYAPTYHIAYTEIKGNLFTGVQIENLRYEDQVLAKRILFRWNPYALIKQNITLSLFKIESLDIEAIQTILNQQAPSKEESSSSFSMAPWGLTIKTLQIDIAPLKEEVVLVNTLVLRTKNLSFSDNRLEVKTVALTLDSNLTQATFEGKIVNNTLLGNMNLLPTAALFNAYLVPLRPEALESISLNLEVTSKTLKASLDKNISSLLKEEEIDIAGLHSDFFYDFSQQAYELNTTATLHTAYAKNIDIQNRLYFDNTLQYVGTIACQSIENVDKNISKLFLPLRVTYGGDAKRFHATLDAQAFEGNVSSKDFKRANVLLKSKKEMALKQFFVLPEALKEGKAFVTLAAPLFLEANQTQKAKLTLDSNLLNVKTNVSYNGSLNTHSVVSLPEDSLLKSYDIPMKWQHFSPFIVDAKMKSKEIVSHIVWHALQSDIRYIPSSAFLDASLFLAHSHINVTGEVQKNLKLNAAIPNVTELLKALEYFTPLGKIPLVEGSLKVEANIDALKEAKLHVASQSLTYHIDKMTEHQVDNFDVNLSLTQETLVLDSYNALYQNEHFFSHRASNIAYNEKQIRVEPLWINDTLQLKGAYNLQTKQGSFETNATSFHLLSELITLDSKIDLQTNLEANKTEIKGQIVLLGGEIHYDLNQKTFASDSDIVIVKTAKEEAQSTFVDGLKTNITLKTKTPLVYHQDGINIKATVNMSLLKEESSEPLAIGTVELLKGGTYIFENKTFVLNQSQIYFTGNLDKPLLDMSVNYKALEYKITIKITGSADLPQIHFSSKPSLTKEQILSLILFDTIEAAGTNSGDEMMKMMGGAMAKSALNDLGIKLDHLVLGEGNSVEVGKKLTRKITIIYVNGDVAKVKLKYEHSPRTESVIGASEISQSYDIIYKRDF